MSTYARKPWLSLYPAGVSADLKHGHGHCLAMLASAVADRPQETSIRYFDGNLTFAELDAAADALAVYLDEENFTAGDRLALFTQNDPSFMIGLLAAWKAGGIAVPVNPMDKAGELRYILADSGAKALLSLDRLYADVAAEVVAERDLEITTVITYSARDFQTTDDERVLDLRPLKPAPGGIDLMMLLRRYSTRKPVPAHLGPDNIAVLTYTSGTTGQPKGAMNTHGNIVSNAAMMREWMGLQPGNAILAIAPLFHITGLVCHAALGLMAGVPIVLTHRFQPDVVLAAIRQYRPSFTVGAITAFTSLSGATGIVAEDFESFTRLYSGGAPIAPAVADQFEARFGTYIHNAYGLTESSSVTHLVPHGRRAPVDPISGALSIGVPVSSTSARIVDESGAEVPPRVAGELLISGPQVAPGYWNKPHESPTAMPNGELCTGDVAFMDEDGWFYIIDRKKDMINASGYKVWPREVEDVLYTHPEVREAAVVGVPDPYRGETVKAFVSLKQPGTEPADIIEYCKGLMAAYKYPRELVILDELPKTTSGKILRRELRLRS